MKNIVNIFFFIGIAFGQKANFFKEDITFRIDGNFMDVEGYYWFANTSSASIKSEIYYPFANYCNEDIDSIRIYNITAGINTNYRYDNIRGISFNLFITPYDTVIFQIGYRQKIVGDSAVYFLRTTQSWNKPLDQAEYKLLMPDSLFIRRFSYSPDKFYKIQGKKIYYWKMNNFMPEQDLIFYFK